MDVGGEDNSGKSPLVLKSTPLQFHQGEHVLASFSGGLHEAKVLLVDSKANLFFVRYHGLNKKCDEWVGMERLMKLNKQKSTEKGHLLKKILGFKRKDFNVNSAMKRKTMTKVGGIEEWEENKFVTSVHDDVRVPVTVVRNPGVKVGVNPQSTLHHVATPRPQVDKPLGPTLQPPIADLLDPESASDVMKARFLAMPETEFLKKYDSMAFSNFVYMVEMKKRYDALKGKEVELKEELMRSKTTITSQAMDIAIMSERDNRLRKELDEARGKVKEMQAERADVIKGASQAEAARAQAEAETAALRAGRLELLGKVSEAEGEAAALKAENVELLKKLAEAEAAKKHEDEVATVKKEND